MAGYRFKAFDHLIHDVLKDVFLVSKKLVVAIGLWPLRVHIALLKPFQPYFLFARDYF